jgi:hypothetical protein
MPIGAKPPKVADKIRLAMDLTIRIIPHFTIRVNPIIKVTGKLIFDAATRHPCKAAIAQSAITQDGKQWYVYQSCPGI